MKNWLVLGIVIVGCGGSNPNELFGPGASGGAAGTPANVSGAGGNAMGGTAGTAGSTSDGGTAGTSGATGGGGSSGTAGGGTAGSGGTSGSGGAGAEAGSGGEAGEPLVVGGAGGEGGGTAGSDAGGAGGAGGAPSCVPSGGERCDGLDNDCSGGVDDGDVCPDDCYGFADDSGHGYMICLGNETWDDARAECQAHDPTFDLVIIEGPDGSAENTFLTDAVLSLVGDASVDVWLGATDVAEEDAWLWWDGTQFYDHEAGTIVNDGWENWAPNRPNNLGNNEHCAVIEINDPAYLDGDWNDVGCDDAGPYVCESSQ